MRIILNFQLTNDFFGVQGTALQGGPNNKRYNARGDQPNNIAPLFMTLCLTSVPTRNGRAYACSLVSESHRVNSRSRNKTDAARISNLRSQINLKSEISKTQDGNSLVVEPFSPSSLLQLFLTPEVLE